MALCHERRLEVKGNLEQAAILNCAVEHPLPSKLTFRTTVHYYSFFCTLNASCNVSLVSYHVLKFTPLCTLR